MTKTEYLLICNYIKTLSQEKEIGRDHFIKSISNSDIKKLIDFIYIMVDPKDDK